jgi:addiction module RelE/StbE family toxin
MLTLLHSAFFDKRYSTLSKKLKRKTKERLKLFVRDPFDRILNNHQLHGEYEGYRSINVTGDMRLIYKDMGNSKYILHEIGTHSQLYE